MNVFNRLLNDSLQKRQRQIYNSRYEQALKDSNEWKKKLSSTRFLAIPSLSQNPPPFSTSRSSLSDTRKKTNVSKANVNYNDIINNVYNVPFREMTMHSAHYVPKTQSFAHTYVDESTEKEKGKVVFSKVLSEKLRIPTKKLDMYSNEAIMFQPIKGIDSFPAPPTKLPKGFVLVPCRSSLVAFFDKQGTY